MRRLVFAVSTMTRRTVKAIPLPGLSLLLALVLVVVPSAAMPVSAFAVGTVAPLDAWPAIPQMTATTGNLAGTFAVSTGTDRLLVVLVCSYDSAFNSGQTFTATYGGETLTQAVLQNDNRWQTWIGYLSETDIASRSGDTVAVGVTGTHTKVVAYIASYSGVDQTTPVTAANGVYIDNLNDRPIGGPLTINAGGYGIYGWSCTAIGTRTSDTETYAEHSDVNNGGPGAFNYGVASKAFATTSTTNPSVAWSFDNLVSVSFITLNPGSCPVPTTTSISPTTKTMGDAGFTLTVVGANFVSGTSVVRLDGADRTTTFVSSTQLTATIPASDLATAGGKSITVFNPAPGGGTSNAQTLRVNKATPTITWANPADIVYGTALSSTQLCATALVDGTFAYSSDLGALLPAGDGQTLHVDFTPTDSANYNTASRDVTINVNKATLTITANNRGKTYGDTVTFSGTEFTAEGLVGSDSITSVTLTSAGATANAAEGSYLIVGSNAVGTGLANYAIAYEDGNLRVFAENGPLPDVTSVYPSQGVLGQNLSVVITGTNFNEVTSVSFGDGVTVDSYTVNSDKQITADITIDSAAKPGDNDIVVATPSGDGLLTNSFAVEISKESSEARVSPWFWWLVALLAILLSLLLLVLNRRTKKTPVLQPTPTFAPSRSLERTGNTVDQQQISTSSSSQLLERSQKAEDRQEAPISAPFEPIETTENSLKAGTPTPHRSPGRKRRKVSTSSPSQSVRRTTRKAEMSTPKQSRRGPGKKTAG